MADLFTIENLMTLFMLIMLQAVLGFDNLLYISLESKRAPAEKQAMVRKLGIGIAVGLRIILLFLLMKIISFFQAPWFSLEEGMWISGEFNLHSIIVLVGGVFLLYTATKEILHMMHIEEHENQGKSSASVAKTIFAIVTMNLIFSFDSILSAMALSDNFIVMAAAIITGGVLMIAVADYVSEFLKKNRMYEVLGLFILFIVGIMLVSEGGHLAHLKFFGYEVTQMSKSTFYFVIVILLAIDIVQTRYQKKILLAKTDK